MEERSRRPYYVDGTAARKLEVAPNYEEYEERERRQRPARKVSKKAETALSFNKRYAIFVLASVAIMMFACLELLHMNTKIDDQRKNIAKLETELAVLSADNQEAAVALDNMYSLDDVYSIATGNLGMTYAKKGQVVYYDNINEDYVRQYEDVPGAN